MSEERQLDHFTTQDRERLITVDVKMEQMREQLRGLQGTINTHASDARADLAKVATDSKAELMRLTSENKAEFGKATTAIEIRLNSHNSRLQILENYRWWLAGVAVGGGFVGALIIKLLHA